MYIYERIEKELFERGITRTELARAIGVSPDVVCYVMRGKRQLYADEFMAICDALGLPTEAFRECAGCKKTQELQIAGIRGVRGVR